MASAGALTIDLNANTARLRSDFNKAGAMTKKYKRQSIAAFKKVKAAVFSLKGAVFGLAGVAGIGALSKSFIDAKSTSEQYAVRLKVLLGSVAEGNRLFKDMTTFAGKVPFEYQNIMNSATQLAGVMKGGVDEIKRWIPLIGDLAATSGLSIEETTEQVVRMYSAGAASADKFRERGILSMLGFKAGVSVTAEETRERLMHSWKKMGSQFRGATSELASSWDGMMSMLSDKWFQFRVQVMEGGLFDWLKGLVAVINGKLGDSIDGTSKKAKSWSDSVINGIESIFRGVAYISDAFNGLKAVFLGLKIAWLGFEMLVNNGFNELQKGAAGFINLLPGIDVKPMQGMERIALQTSQAFHEAKSELAELLSVGVQSDEVTGMLANIRTEAERIASAANKPLSTGGSSSGGDLGFSDSEDPKLLAAIATEDQLDLLYEERAVARLEKEKEQAALWDQVWANSINNFAGGIGNAVGDAVVEQKSLGEALKATMKGVAKQVISSLVEIGVKQAILAATSQAQEKVIVASGVASAGALTLAYKPAATFASLASFGANSAPAIAGMSATAAVADTIAIAGAREFGGPVSAGKAYLVGEKRPEIFVPNTSGNILPNTDSVGANNSAESSSTIVFSPVVQAYDADSILEQEDKVFSAMLNRFTDWMNENGKSFA